ncbi:helicase-related protein [Weeksella virosa]|uniref:Helicase domain protein n=1 Tax=Weeksella virosa (strain ATCC 43766 / DSM 16922 / JCM 21250 / CCUG 30538 / CDC 9751 / IAM 14551 / NBRC 16016 / NCTC 11634 / CL345/78) TaxID=865938 RepID=F0P1C7_WEEVC|nr:helicase-related protein [Weeksella virosa]ADX68641.1 helicase domain protein [Weeksella virosa DSM 16922]VEH63690.1 ATP-dependent helicase HepA [Weeksella virosa]
MPNNFITNNKQQKTLKTRLNTLISISDELKFLVGFFYFNGWSEIYLSLQKNPQQKLKLLVGLQVCNYLGNIIEYAEQGEEDSSRDEVFQNYLISLGFALNNEEMDTEDFYNQVGFFVQMIEEDRLEIRKTENPNHAKLYLFQYNEEYAHNLAKNGEFITGSSNLTRSGLRNQEEFNVEISDYGYENAVQYFDELWERATPITEHLENRKILIDFIKNKTQVATITPFEAYCLVIKTYLDLQNQENEEVDLDSLLEKIDLKKFSYQSDAVNQAIQMIKEHNGCIIADVVGLGKSVIASMIARQMNKRGIIICPPGLMGDAEKKDSGWWEYLEKFGLHNWQVYSRGIIDRIADNIEGRDFEVVIVDEAHYFRNQDTADYEALSMICRGKKVILLSATPFNNSPKDIEALLSLFTVPGKSTITLEDNLKGRFSRYNYEYKQLSIIYKNWNSADDKKRKQAENIYTTIIDENLPIDIKKVKERTKILSNEIKRTISPVVIRRNRLDLKQDYVYANEIGELSVVKDPEEVFYYLDTEQDEFYDNIISKYFAENGVFTGAIYQPFSYEKILSDKLDEFGNRQYNQQKNLYDFMRRILVKRFESSFGSFEKSIERFLQVHLLVKDFIDKTGKFILDRSFIDRIKDFEIEDIEANLEKYAAGDLKRKTPKNNEVYDISTFQRRQEFLDDIASDIQLFEAIQKRLKDLKLVEKDPKQEEIIKKIKNLLVNEPDRKIILFSEYVDTIHHLEKRFRKEFGNDVLICDGKVSKELAKNLNSDFNAQYKGSKTNHFKILLTSDKLSEGFNLNRAGVIINYDIPWNPTRVIQRVGRINRIGSKVYDELFILNFFPSLKGADIVKSREIAQQKMFLIHNALGEDAKIFDEDEEPTPAALGSKINSNPEEEGEVNTITKIRNIFSDLQKKHPEIIAKISQLPPRVKTAKSYPEYELNVLRRKGLSLFAQTVGKEESRAIREIDFEELLQKIECKIDEPTLKLSSVFWNLYEEIKEFKPKYKMGRSEISLEQKAMENLRKSHKVIKDLKDEHLNFIQMLIKDLRYYHTLSMRSIRRIGGQELTDDKKSIRSFLEEITYLKQHLGENYLDDIESRTKSQSKEVIIAIENNDLKELFH